LKFIYFLAKIQDLERENLNIKKAVEETKGRSEAKKAIGKKIVNDVIIEAGKPGKIDSQSSQATALIKVIQNPVESVSIIDRGNLNSIGIYYNTGCMVK